MRSDTTVGLGLVPSIVARAVMGYRWIFAGLQYFHTVRGKVSEGEAPATAPATAL